MQVFPWGGHKYNLKFKQRASQGGLLPASRKPVYYCDLFLSYTAYSIKYKLNIKNDGDILYGFVKQ